MGARLVVAGVCMEPDTVLPLFATAKEINVQFVNAYDAAEFAESLRTIAEGEIGVAPLITGEVGLDGVGTAFDELSDPDRHCKILVLPEGIVPGMPIAARAEDVHPFPPSRRRRPPHGRRTLRRL